jgi:hypothetical protein
MQTHLSLGFCSAAKQSSASRRYGSRRWPQFCDRPHDVGEELFGNGDLGHLECDVAAMADGAKAIVAAVTSAEAMQANSGGLGANGTMMVIGAVVTVNSHGFPRKTCFGAGLVFGHRGRLGRHALFSQLNDIALMNEICPLTNTMKVNLGYTPFTSEPENPLG